ncbi:MAG TPA: BadF/BadG/BcrA/BcrD ATPase family protein [Acidobacteriaceae bacterium]|nr:BadF/BadG/BcrA/BcrD ATPase family protein [Acidobacteriaceae bacterium]
MAFYLGLDAGGTKTTALLGDETRTLARAVGGSIKPLRVSIEQAQQSLSTLLTEISRVSSVNLLQLTASSVGTAGLRLPQTDGWMRQIISHCAGGAIEVCGDEEIALDAAFPGGAGVLVIAGTGSNILARTSTGDRLTVGGWGPMLGDQGSGYWIGHQALRAALRAKDFRRPTPILERVITFWKLNELADVINVAHSGADFSQLAPIVAQCAEEGDAVALEVLIRGGRILGEDAAEAFRQLRALEPDQPMPSIAFIGGILDKVTFVRDAMTETIHLAAPTVQILPEAVDAVSGALWRARHFAK